MGGVSAPAHSTHGARNGRDARATPHNPNITWVGELAARVLGAELALIKKGIDLPVGGSRLVVAQKI